MRLNCGESSSTVLFSVVGFESLHLHMAEARLKQKSSHFWELKSKMAEEEGFEPS